MFVLKNTDRGWIIEFCIPVRVENYTYRTARMQWRQAPEKLNPNFVFPDYETAKAECDEKNGITKKG